MYTESMGENQSVREVEPNKPLAEAVREVFERRARAGERKLILETYQQKFDQLLQTLPKENRDRLAVKIQKFFININGWLSEYGARFGDFIRSIVVWPMIRGVKDFPQDPIYQIELARAQAWGDFALRTTKTATAARTAYRDKLLPSAITFGALGAVGTGIVYGAQYGAIAGLQGAAIGAAAGGIIGGGISLGLRVKDLLMGPPAVYYSYGLSPVGNVASSVTGSISDALVGKY